MFGFLNIDKPAGCTSRDVVNRVQRLVRPHKVGHAGTLDPLATGVLVVAVGPATRLVSYVQQQRKVYRGTFLLGRSSPTEDVEGEVSVWEGAPEPTRDEIEAVLPMFVGQIMQRPPAFSALKVGGQRAHALARQGTAVELPPRPVTVYGIDLVRYCYPELELDVACGGGTYIRSLGRDIAAAAGTRAVMSQLRRTAIGPFTVERAVAVDVLTSETVATHLSPATWALEPRPRVVVTRDEWARLAHGQPITLPKGIISEGDLAQGLPAEPLAVDGAGHLVALLELRDDGRLWPLKNFAVPARSDGGG